MKKVYRFENCRVIVNIPDDDDFQERVRKASEKFMRKIMLERTKVNGNRNKT
jgi:hypothetical protein